MTRVALVILGGSILAAGVIWLSQGGESGPAEPPAGGATVEPARALVLPETTGVRGVWVKARAGGVEIERMLPYPGFTLAPGESIDPRLPAGPLEAELVIRFDRRAVREAAFGVEVEGAQADLEVAHARAEGGQGVFTERIRLEKGVVEVRVRFRWDGVERARMLALWKPGESVVSHAIPAVSGAWRFESGAFWRGLLLASVSRCGACHEAGSPLPAGPILGEIGGRARPAWVREWIADPARLKPGTSMPRLDVGAGDGGGVLDDLTHFLVSLGGPISEAEDPVAPEFVVTGRIAYHELGCVPCHGPLDGHGQDARDVHGFVPLGDLAAKTTLRALTATLRDPLGSHPAGGMPSFDLSDVEAKAIAAYLIERTSRQPPPWPIAAEPFVLDLERVRRGREAFGTVGCAACHALGPNHPPVESRRVGPALAALESARCAVADYDLAGSDAACLGAFVRGLPARSAPGAHDRALVTLERHRCLACHVYGGAGGPDPAIQGRFACSGESDLGDESRFPPDLTEAGSRLTGHWLAGILDGTLGSSRPYMRTRMPVFGTGVGNLAGDLALAAARARAPAEEFVDSRERAQEAAALGREIVGSSGRDCISCHDVAGGKSTGSPGLDLARVPERLPHDSFVRWLFDPDTIRSGTRMPTFFAELPADERMRRIEAVWAYLVAGAEPPPAGLERGSRSLEIVPAERPMILRTFMADVGVRAIACGFPERIHVAFDADGARLALAWEGRFLDASGAWANRGGTETNPLGEGIWRAPPGPAFTAGAGAGGSRVRFRGYELEASSGRPIFEYDVAVDSGISVRVREAPRPARRDGVRGLSRAFSLVGPPGAVLWFQGPDGPRRVELDREGRASFEVEVSW